MKAEIHKSEKSVCLYGHHEMEYPRNRIVRQSMEQAGWRVVPCRSRAPFPFRHFILALKYLRLRRQVSVIWITEGGHRLVPFARLMAWCTGKRLIFDPYISRYNTRIEDRGLYRQKGLQALVCLWQDWSSTHAADFLVFDTMMHKDYFFRKYSLKKPFGLFPLGADETVFAPRKTSFRSGDSVFEVLFYGTFIPLQGAEHIVDAAHILRHRENIRFTLIGAGQTLPAIEKKVRELKLPNLVMKPPVPEPQLPGIISRAGLCLGIFGATVKAGLVVPNKVVQSAAMGKAIITARTGAIQQYFRDNQDLLLANPGDGNDLAGKILQLAENSKLRERLEVNARKKFEEHFSLNRLGELMNDILVRNAKC